MPNLHHNTAAIKANNTKILTKRTVIGLQNLDTENGTYREYKQLVERLNRTYKFHSRPRAGFKDFDGACALTTLFVTYYNFMRLHGSLNHRPPVEKTATSFLLFVFIRLLTEPVHLLECLFWND